MRRPRVNSRRQLSFCEMHLTIFSNGLITEVWHGDDDDPVSGSGLPFFLPSFEILIFDEWPFGSVDGTQLLEWMNWRELWDPTKRRSKMGKEMEKWRTSNADPLFLSARNYFFLSSSFLPSWGENLINDHLLHRRRNCNTLLHNTITFASWINSVPLLPLHPVALDPVLVWFTALFLSK